MLKATKVPVRLKLVAYFFGLVLLAAVADRGESDISGYNIPDYNIPAVRGPTVPAYPLYLPTPRNGCTSNLCRRVRDYMDDLTPSPTEVP
jgi:hypothetical protein